MIVLFYVLNFSSDITPILYDTIEAKCENAPPQRTRIEILLLLCVCVTLKFGSYIMIMKPNKIYFKRTLVLVHQSTHVFGHNEFSMQK